MKMKYSLANEKYIPGFIGINNLKANDYMNVVIQLLTHVPPLRNFFILENLEPRAELVKRFSLITRKIWNPKAFKGHVSPHEFLQQVTSVTKNQFRVDEQGDPAEFLTRLLNDLHKQLGGNPRKQASSIIYKLFQGQVHMQSQEIVVGGGVGEVEGRESRLTFVPGRAIVDRDVQFLMLTLDLPAPPLFQDEIDKNIIPQVDIFSLLAKYDGRTSQVNNLSYDVSNEQELAGERRRFKISKLPPYMIFHIKRLKKTEFTHEHNPTIVTFPITSLDMKDYAYSFAAPPGTSTMYDLIGNITHESVWTPGGDEKHVYRAQVKDFSRDKWFVIQDLIVEELEKERMHLAESYIQVTDIPYERY